MYHVRKASDHDERSLHIENERGLHNAIEESVLRATHTGEVYQVVDDNGRLVATIGPAPDDFELPAPKKTFGWSPFLFSALFAAMLIFMLVQRR